MLIRQQSQYRFTPHDVELTVDLQLDILNEPLNQLALTADPALRVVQVTHAGRQLRWTEHLSDQRLELLLEMPEPLIGLDHRIRFQALAPIELGRTWQLADGASRAGPLVACNGAAGIARDIGLAPIGHARVRGRRVLGATGPAAAANR
jgi:hypothetical protein